MRDILGKQEVDDATGTFPEEVSHATILVSRTSELLWWFLTRWNMKIMALVRQLAELCRDAASPNLNVYRRKILYHLQVYDACYQSKIATL